MPGGVVDCAGSDTTVVGIICDELASPRKAPLEATDGDDTRTCFTGCTVRTAGGAAEL